MTRSELGIGWLNWPVEERRSDRYGYVTLLSDMWDAPSNPCLLNAANAHLLIGQKGRLVALVVETRLSTHIGDLHHMVFPKVPRVGEEIVLGEGWLDVKMFNGDPCVGLIPPDNRETLWLDIEALYRCHEQTVSLYFEPKVDA